jgi:hypothetical protein
MVNDTEIMFAVGFMLASGTGIFTVAVIVEYMSIVEASPNSAIKSSERPLAVAEVGGMLGSMLVFTVKSISSKAKLIVLQFFMSISFQFSLLFQLKLFL